VPCADQLGPGDPPGRRQTTGRADQWQLAFIEREVPDDAFVEVLVAARMVEIPDTRLPGLPAGAARECAGVSGTSTLPSWPPA
jgi:hypothetical protein